MTSEDMRTGLPPAFLAALAGQAGPQAQPVQLALQRVQNLPEGAARDDLLLALLEGALRETAPQWLLEQAIESGLREEQDPQWSTAGQVAATALAHPACTEPVRDKALHNCTAQQLGALVRRSRSARLAEAVASHLGQCEPAPQPMTVDRLKNPGTAELLLAAPGLPDIVLAAALNLLPTRPALDEAAAAGGDGDRPAQAFRLYRDAVKAWEQMWGAVVNAQVRGARSLLAWAGDTPARSVIRDHLLETLPWDVEPDLLEEAATEDLAAFATAGGRHPGMPPAGGEHPSAGSPQPTPRRPLEPAAHRPRASRVLPRRRARATCADRRPRCRLVGRGTHAQHLAVPARSRPDPAAGPATGLAGVRRPPDPDRPQLRHHNASRAAPVGARHEPLRHLPRTRTAMASHAAGPPAPDHRRRPPAGERSAATPAAAHRLQLGRLRLRGTPAGTGAGRPACHDPTHAQRHRSDTPRRSLGSPQEVTAAQLARVDEQALRDYLERHHSDDLLEKALLSFISAAQHSQSSFAEILALHSTPAQALVRITAELRSRAGGGPQNRERWIRLALASPDPSEDLIRALPAWTALSTGGSRFDTAHPQVTRLVLSALGDSEGAWARFADSPASYAGPTAWLRLGDVLDAAVEGTDWPRPPAAH